MQTYRYVVHRNGPALWPDHKPLDEVLTLKATTPELVFEATYQGNPTPAGGYTFRREWWSGQNRYTPGEYLGEVVGRFQSWDTAEGDGDNNAYAACITGEILTDYRLVVRHAFRERLTFDVLPATIESMARQYNGDGRLHSIVIEDKSSGKAANQTLKATSEEWLRDLISPYQPVGSKVHRASQAAVWCRNGMVLLPHPHPAAPWLMDMEDELFSFPQSSFADQVDALSQLIQYTEHYLAEGWSARRGR